MTGLTANTPSSVVAGGTTLALELAPYESRVLVLDDSAPTVADRRGRPTPRSLPIQGPWTVSVEGKPSRNISLPYSWADGAQTRFVSATFPVRFNARFELPVALGPRSRVVLDFGDGTAITPAPLKNGFQAALDAPIRDAATVRVNEHEVGRLWRPPYRLDITAAVRRGSNALELDVANTAMNAMAGRPLPDYRLLNQRYGVRFEPQDLDRIRPEPSGLLAVPSLVIEDVQ
jgi:hypothetical protein